MLARFQTQLTFFIDFFFKVKHFCVCLFNIGHAPCSSQPQER